MPGNGLCCDASRHPGPLRLLRSREPRYEPDGKLLFKQVLLVQDGSCARRLLSHEPRPRWSSSHVTWEVGAGRSLGEGNLRSWRTEKNDTAQRRRDNLRKSPALGATFPSRVTLVSTISETGLARLGRGGCWEN